MKTQFKVGDIVMINEFTTIMTVFIGHIGEVMNVDNPAETSYPVKIRLADVSNNVPFMEEELTKLGTVD